MSTEKHVHLQSPYTSSMLNEVRSLLHGSRIGRVLSGLNPQHIPPVKKEEGLGNLSLHGTDAKIRVLTDPSAAFISNTVSIGDWLVVGGDILLSYVNDRPKYLKGNVSAGLANFYDGIDAPFKVSDVNKLLMIYSSSEYAMHKILAYNTSGDVLTDHTFGSNLSNIAYALLEAVGNWGIYEVSKIVSETVIEVNAVKEFVSFNNEPFLGLTYGCYTPAKAYLPEGSFINNGVITEIDSPEEVLYPATWMLPNTPPLFLVAHTHDEREASPVNFEVVLGQHSSPNAVVLAASQSKYYEQGSEWFSAAPHSPRAIRADIDRLITGHGRPGWHTKPFAVEFDDVPWPPRLRVSYPSPDDGGVPKHPSMSTKSQASVVNFQHSQTLLEVDVRPPVASGQGSRIDHLVVVSRKNGEHQIDTLQGEAVPEGIGENYLSYNVGVANGFYYSEKNSFNPLSEAKGSGVLQVSGYHGQGCAPKVIANSYGTVMLAHAEDDGVDYHMMFHRVTPEDNDFDKSTSPAKVDVVCSDRPSQTLAAVDGNGCFHFIWQENFASVYYMKLDPYGVNAIQGYTLIPGVTGIASNSFDMCVSLTGVVSFLWKDGTDLKVTSFAPDGQGSLNVLAAPTAVVSLGLDYHDAGIEQSWDSDRLTVVAFDTSVEQCVVSLLETDLSLITTYSIPTRITADPGAVLDLGVEPYRLRLLRNNMDEIVLFIHGDSESYGYSLLATKIFPFGISDQGYFVCDPYGVDEGAYFIGVDFSPTDDGGWVCYGNNNKSGFGDGAFLRLSQSLEVLTRSTNHNPFDSFDIFNKRTSSIAYIPKYGDVINLFVDSVDDTTDGDLYGGFIEGTHEGRLPTTLSGFGPNKFSEDQRYVLADIHLTRGSVPNRPGKGFHLQPDNVPLTSSLLAEPRLVDGHRDGGIEGLAGTSYGISATDLNSFTGKKYSCILLIDSIKSDGFVTTDPLSYFEVYGSDDNSNWTLLTIKELYRVEGHTYIAMNEYAYAYFKVRVTAEPEIPSRLSPSKTSVIHVEEMRLLDSRPDWLETTNNTDDGRAIRGVQVRFKNLPELEPLYVGDGRNSFGRFLGADGLQQALYDATVTTADSDKFVSRPRGVRKIRVGAGFYEITRGMHVPCGSDVEFEPDAILRDRTGFGLLYSNKTLYSEGYNEAGVAFFKDSRQIVLSQNLRFYGIKEGCFVFFGSGDHLTRIISLSKCGHVVTLEKRIPTASGTSEVTVFGPSVRLTGLKVELLSGSPKLSDYHIEFKFLEDLILKNVNITDETTVANGQGLIKIDRVKNVWLEDFLASTASAILGLYIRQCWTVGGAKVFCTAPNGSAVWIQQCINYMGIDGLNGLGDGSVGSDLIFTDTNGRSGRLGSKDSLNGTGVTSSGNTWAFDEFMKLRVLEDFICNGYTLINGGAYEFMLSMVIGWVQAFHSIPWTAVPSGWVDGLVDDSVIDWTA